MTNEQLTPSMPTYLKNKWQFIGSWIFLSIVVCILISLAQTLAREVTLDNVRAYDFKIIRTAIKHQKEVNNNYFQEITSELSTRNGSIVLFPLAIIEKNSCSQNGKLGSNNKICEFFKNIDEWELKTSSKNINNYYKIKYKFFEKEVYMYAELDSEKVLVGQAGNYLHLHGDDFAQIIEFITNRLPNNYINSIYGITSIYYKSKWSMLIFFFGSTLVLVIFLSLTIRKERQHANELNYAKNLVAEKENQCHLLQSKIDESNNILSDRKEKVESFQIQLRNNEIKLEKYDADIESLIEDLTELEGKHKILQSNLNDIEAEKHKLITNVEFATSRINNAEAKNELQSYQSKYNKIVKLWDSSTKWAQRREIEESVNAKQRVPFTLSTAFIAFEAWVDDYYKDLSAQNHSNEITTLNEKIDVVIRKQPHLRLTLHSIRVARNAWFHNGKIPEKGLIKELLKIINDVEPRI